MGSGGGGGMSAEPDYGYNETLGKVAMEELGKGTALYNLAVYGVPSEGKVVMGDDGRFYLEKGSDGPDPVNYTTWERDVKREGKVMYRDPETNQWIGENEAIQLSNKRAKEGYGDGDGDAGQSNTYGHGRDLENSDLNGGSKQTSGLQSTGGGWDVGLEGGYGEGGYAEGAYGEGQAGESGGVVKPPSNNSGAAGLQAVGGQPAFDDQGRMLVYDPNDPNVGPISAQKVNTMEMGARADVIPWERDVFISDSQTQMARNTSEQNVIPHKEAAEISGHQTQVARDASEQRIMPYDEANKIAFLSKEQGLQGIRGESERTGLQYGMDLTTQKAAMLPDFFSKVKEGLDANYQMNAAEGRVAQQFADVSGQINRDLGRRGVSMDKNQAAAAAKSIALEQAKATAAARNVANQQTRTTNLNTMSGALQL